MSKGRKCKKKGKKKSFTKVVATVGAVMAVRCPGPPEAPDQHTSHEQ